MKAFTVLAAACCIPGVFSHYIWDVLIVNGTSTPSFSYVRKNSNYNSPVEYNVADFRCNVGSQASAKSTKVATVEAGSKIGMSNQVGAAHIGAVMFYMSKAPSGDAISYDGSGDWFKVYEVGPNGLDGQPINTMKTFTFTIPASLPDGAYLLRAERLSTHIPKQPQFYVGCAQLNIVGGGNGTPGPTIKIPGGYKAGDPTVFMDPYNGGRSLKTPGPAVWSG